MPRDYQLLRYDLASRTLSAVASLPTSFIPWPGLRFLRAGDRLAIYGVPTDANSLTEDAPHLLVVDTAARRLTTDLRLDGVKAGQFRTPENTFETIHPGLAWDIPRDRLYLANADEDRLTVVDLAKGIVVRRTDIRPGASLPQRLADWLVPAAAAKGNPETVRQAIVSDDGARLYLSDQRTATATGADARSVQRAVSFAVRVLDTRDLHEVRRYDLRATSGFMLPAPDGHLLIQTFLDDGTAASDAAQLHGQRRLAIVDTTRQAVIGSIDLPEGYDLQGTSPDGSYAYLRELVTGSGTPASQSWTIHVLDLDTHRFVVARAFESSFGGGLFLARPGR